MVSNGGILRVNESPLRSQVESRNLRPSPVRASGRNPWEPSAKVRFRHAKKTEVYAPPFQWTVCEVSGPTGRNRVARGYLVVRLQRVGPHAAIAPTPMDPHRNLCTDAFLSRAPKLGIRQCVISSASRPDPGAIVRVRFRKPGGCPQPPERACWLLVRSRRACRYTENWVSVAANSVVEGARRG